MNARVDPHANGEQTNAPIFPNPDVVQLKRFADVLFKHAAPVGFVSLRGFQHRDRATTFINPISLGDPQFMDVVCERASQAAAWREPAVFCPPVATFKTGKSAAEDNVLEGVTLAGELDESPNAAIAKLTEWLGEPTLAMQSGGEWINPKTGEIEPKLHTHWRLKVPARTSEDLRRLKEARALLVHLVDGDPTAAPVCHPLRWAGSWHTKGEPRLATIVSESDNEIDLAEALDTLREEAGAAGIGASGKSSNFHRAEGGPPKLLARNPKDVARALAVIPNDEVPDPPLMVVGFSAVVTFAGCPLTSNATLPLNPLLGVTRIVTVPELCRLIVMLTGDAESAKSPGVAGFTINCTPTVCTIEPLVPVTIML